MATANTAPYWPSTASCSLTPNSASGIIAENVSTISVSCTRAKDDESDAITYRFRWYRSGTLVKTTETTLRTDNYDYSNVNPGAQLYCKVDCKDSSSSYGNALVSNVITKNTLSAAYIFSSASIAFDTASIILSRSDGKNANGNTPFTYELSSSNITVYNPTWSSSSKTLNLTIWRTGDAIPSGAYIKFDDIKSHVASNGYRGSISFILTTTNAYGTSKTNSVSVDVNIRQYPTSFSLNTPGNYYTINGVNYYVINKRAVILSWQPSTDPLGTSITYNVDISIDDGEWQSLATDLTTTSVLYPIQNISRSRTLKFRVTAKSEYGTMKIVTKGSNITLHYFHTPTIEKIKVIRNTTNYTISWQVTQRTSIPNSLIDNTFTFVRDSTTLQQISISDSSGTSRYTAGPYTFNMSSESESYTLNISWTDYTSSIFGETPDPITYVIPRYAAILTIREKGVGINAVAGSATNCMIKGNPQIQLTDWAHIGGIAAKSIYIYDKVYRDSEGKLRAAVAIQEGETVNCLVLNSMGVRVGKCASQTTVAVDEVATLSAWSWTTHLAF